MSAQHDPEMASGFEMIMHKNVQQQSGGWA